MRRCWSAVVAGVIATCMGTAFAAVDDPQSSAGQPLQEVTVTATRALDHHALSRAVSGFVESHSAPTTRINQILSLIHI